MKAIHKKSPIESGDLVLREIWRIKDEQSFARDHDIHRLFAEARKKQKSLLASREKFSKQAPSIRNAMSKGDEEKA